MRRGSAILLVTAVMASAAPGATAAGSKAKGARERTFYVVAGSDQDSCALSSDLALADPSHWCGTRADAATAPVLGAETVWIEALDGLPVALDTTRPIRGAVTVNSRYAWGWFAPVGAGQAQLEVTVAGVAGGEEVTVGSVTSEPYTVTPGQVGYEVAFEIDPDPALAGATLTDLRVGLEVQGPNVAHNLYYADGKSTVTIPVAARR